MNIYDFDYTIYAGDSSVDFFFYCLKRKPCMVILICLPKFIWTMLLYKMGKRSKEQLKETFFHFLTYFSDIDQEVAGFWEKNECKICSWYLKQKEPDDIIISASPEFLLLPIAMKLHVHVVASKVSKKTGDYDGKNCYGEEKVRRLKELKLEKPIQKVYSDSLSDKPLLILGKEAYLVNNKSGCIEVIHREELQ